MENLFNSPGVFFTWLWRASWQASVVIVLVFVLQWLLRKHLSPRWRHTLWLLVVVRMALPLSVESPVSLFNLFADRSSGTAVPTGIATGTLSVDAEAESTSAQPRAEATTAGRGWGTRLAWIWLAGAVLLPSYLLVTSVKAGRRVRRERPLTDEAVLNLLEDCKQAMRVSTPLTLIETTAVSSPSLFGFVRPRLLLPRGFTRNFSLAELRYVFLHELGHLKRGDVAMNWLATLPLILHWFNPLVWFAVARMRADGEVACDALALSHTGEAESKCYGQTIIKLLEHFSQPTKGPGLVGIIENKHEMKRRIRMIASFKRRTAWPAVAATVFIGLGLVTLTDAQSGLSADNGNNRNQSGAQEPPRILATSPQAGATGVDPAISEITVTFDRDMGGGFSWTGGGPDYPPIQEGQKPRWLDRRTCALPVKLEAASYYRVGINSQSFRNFRSAEGVPALPTAIFFTTQGASQDLKDRVLKPQIVHVYPPHGATDVDPGLTQLTVTFNVPMGGGFSWTGGGPQFPTIPEGKKAYWAVGQKTCVLPVELKPGTQYKIGLNSPSHDNFQSASGVPLEPAVYTFTTRP